MATVANVKKVDMTQLEFQNLGSSAVQCVLQQPLLENSSTYTCELTSLQLSLDGESLLPVGEEFLTIGYRPINGQIADLEILKQIIEGDVQDVIDCWYGDLISSIMSPELQAIAVADPEFDPETSFWLYRTIFIDPTGNQEMILDTNNLPDLVQRFMPESTSVHFKRYQTRVGLVNDIIDQIDRLGRLLYSRVRVMGLGMGAFVPWHQVMPTDRFMRAQLNEDGNLIVSFHPLFWRFYFVRFGPGWERLMGAANSHDFMLGYTTPTGIPAFVTSIDEAVANLGGTQNTFLRDIEQTFTHQGRISDIMIAAGFTAADIQTYSYDPLGNRDVADPNGFNFSWGNLVNGVWQYGLQPWNPNRFRCLPPYNPNVPRGRHFVSSVDISSFDNLKKVVVEASFPISHTLCWEDTEERHKIQFQEFRIFHDLERNVNPTSGELQFLENTEIGPRRFLDNSGSLALKKLFEGQIQALRIDVLREDEEGEKAREKRVVDMQDSSFMYLKFLFTKETV